MPLPAVAAAAGVTHEIRVAEVRKAGAMVLPNLQPSVRLAGKLLPTKCTTVPPVVAPEMGERLDTL